MIDASPVAANRCTDVPVTQQTLPSSADDIPADIAAASDVNQQAEEDTNSRTEVAKNDLITISESFDDIPQISESFDDIPPENPPGDPPLEAPLSAAKSTRDVGRRLSSAGLDSCKDLVAQQKKQISSNIASTVGSTSGSSTRQGACRTVRSSGTAEPDPAGRGLRPRDQTGHAVTHFSSKKRARSDDDMPCKQISSDEKLGRILHDEANDTYYVIPVEDSARDTQHGSSIGGKAPEKEFSARLYGPEGAFAAAQAYFFGSSIESVVKEYGGMS